MGSYNLDISLNMPKITIFRQFLGDNTFFVFFLGEQKMQTKS